jgi:hypothetical protein
VVGDDSSKRLVASRLDRGGMWVAASTDATERTWARSVNIIGETDIDNSNLTVTTDKLPLVNSACVYVVDKSFISTRRPPASLRPATAAS